MSYRDDRDAAHARADALARELEVERRRREAAEAEAAAHAEDNAALRQRLDRDAPASVDPQAAADAARHLEALAGRGAASSPAPDVPADRRSPRARARRLARSADMLAAMPGENVPAYMLLSWLVPLGAVGGLREWGGVQVPLAAGIVAIVAAPLAVLAAIIGARLTGAARIARWVASRPYQLVGVVEALETPPPETDHHLQRGGGHRSLTIEMRFGAAPPAVVAGALRAFDAELELRDGGARATRPSPFVRAPGRNNSQVLDHNHAVFSWLRRLDRDVLTPLHAAHGLRQVTVTLA